MQIIKQGTLPKDKAHTVTCRHCHTRFKIVESEARKVYDQRDGDFLVISCPLCKLDCFIYPK